MKLRAINIIEIILFLLFSLGYIFHSARIPYLNLMIFVVGMLLGCLYWPLGFYTLKAPGVTTVYSTAASLLFASTLIQIMFAMFKWPTHVIVFEIIIAIYLATLLTLVGISFFKKQKGQPIAFDKGLLIRFAIYLLFLLHAFFNYVSKK
ncbi:MAG: hypothetical protein ABIN13_06695 [Mucilaginibacter sp.]